MKKFTLLLLCVLCFSCDDGYFDAPAFDFSETVYDCDVVDNKYVLFRLAAAESLIITLTNQQIKNEVTTEPVEVAVTGDNVIYRTFDAEVSSSYFCQTIPPVEPRVVANWTGSTGSASFIIVETIEELDENDILIGYRHFITFENLKLENGDNSITYEEEIFGEFVTYL